MGGTMLAVGIITLFLTAFMLAFYGYMNHHDDEHDVSFFLSVGLISMVMNLATNAAGGGALNLGWLYLIIDVIFLGVGFAINADVSVDFYKSLVPWCKKVFGNAGYIGWQLLSLFCFPAGMSLYFVWSKTEKNELALQCGKMSLWGILVWIVLFWTILGIAL